MMKNKLFILFLFISALGFAQVPIFVDNINYVADNDKKTIFEFRDGTIRNTENNQTKIFTVVGEFKQISPNFKYAECFDDGGFKCAIMIGYNPKNQKYAKFQIYNNGIIGYECKISKWGIPKGYVPKKDHQMFEGTYTQEEINEFLNFLVMWETSIYNIIN